MQAVKTNVEGTHNVIRAAGMNSVRKVICLSTDKAAYPINAMGISKALMEKVAIAASRNIEDVNELDNESNDWSKIDNYSTIPVMSFHRRVKSSFHKCCSA